MVAMVGFRILDPIQNPAHLQTNLFLLISDPHLTNFDFFFFFYVCFSNFDFVFTWVMSRGHTWMKFLSSWHSENKNYFCVHTVGICIVN